MIERLNNEQIAQRIIEANSDIKRYLNLAPGFKLTPPQPKTINFLYHASMPQTLLPRTRVNP